MFVDSHAHLISCGDSATIEKILCRAHEAGIEKIINVCTTPQELTQGILLESSHSWIRNAAALPPQDATKDSFFQDVEEAAKTGKLAAIGETGLDYHHFDSAHQKQQRAQLISYLHLALECRLPVIFHCRNAFHDLFAIADAEHPRGSPSIVHCFTGTAEEAAESVERGWMISLSGILTFRNNESLRQIVEQIPLSHLLLETDAPWLAPQSRRGNPNEPAFLTETARCLANIKHLSLEELARITTENANRIFK